MPVIAKKNYDSDEVLFRVLESNENGEVQDFLKLLKDDKNRRLRKRFKELFAGKMEKSYQDILRDNNLKGFAEQKIKYSQAELENAVHSVREVKNTLTRAENADKEVESLKEASRNESQSVKVTDEVARFKDFLKKPFKAESADFKDCVFATVKDLDESAFKAVLIASLKNESLADLTAMAKNFRQKTIHVTIFIYSQKEVLIDNIMDLTNKQKELSELAEEVKALKDRNAELEAQAQSAGLKAELPQSDLQESQTNEKELPQDAQNQEAQEKHNEEMNDISSKLDSNAHLAQQAKEMMADLNNDSFTNANEQRNENYEREQERDDEKENNARTMY